MLLAHGHGICPLEIMAILPGVAALWAMRGLYIERVKGLLR